MHLKRFIFVFNSYLAGMVNKCVDNVRLEAKNLNYAKEKKIVEKEIY